LESFDGPFFRLTLVSIVLLFIRYNPSLSVGGKTNVFNLHRVTAWLPKGTTHHQHRIPPETTYRCIDIPRFTGGIRNILFTDYENVVLSTSNAMLYRYKLAKSSGRRSTLIWRYQSSSDVTSMAQIGSNVVVAGTVHGELCLLDWTKHCKERSFSNDQRPIILRRFVPHDGLTPPREDILLGKRMGILELRTQTASSTCQTGKEEWGRCCISWVTQCGWILSVVLESPTIRDTCKVIHSTPKTIYKSADGTIIDVGQQSWSLPQSAVGVHLSYDVICMVDVPTVTKVLSHHDKFVLDSQPNITRSKQKSLIVYSEQGKRKIYLPNNICRLPQSLTLHPSREWMVVAEGSRMHLLTSRKCSHCT
jgi:hypothetical protein